MLNDARSARSPLHKNSFSKFLVFFSSVKTYQHRYKALLGSFLFPPLVELDCMFIVKIIPFPFSLKLFFPTVFFPKNMKQCELTDVMKSVNVLQNRKHAKFCFSWL